MKYEKLRHRMTPAPSTRKQRARENYQESCKRATKALNAFKGACKEVHKTSWEYHFYGGLEDKEQGRQVHESVREIHEKNLKIQKEALEAYLAACKEKAQKLNTIFSTDRFVEKAKKAGWFKGKSWSPSV